MPKWLQLMRTGEFTDRHKTKHVVTIEKLNAIQKNYNREFPAHLVVGHPDRPSVPSFGIVDKLKVLGDKLLFQPGKVVAEFSTLVSKGGFPFVSVGVDMTSNRLDHVAFLSATNPSIKGLEPIAEFSTAPVGSDIISMDISDIVKTDLAEFSNDGWIGWRIQDIGSLFRKIRDYLIVKDGLEKADAVIPDYLVSGLQENMPVVESTAQFSQGGTMDVKEKEQFDAALAQVATLSTKLAEFEQSSSQLGTTVSALTAENAALKLANATLTNATTVAEFSQFVEKLITDKKILPGEKDQIIKDLSLMHKASSLAEFSEGDAATTPLAVYKAQLEARPATVPGNTHTVTPRQAEFSEGDFDPVVVGKKARSYMDEQLAKGITVSATDACDHVKNG
ncbi:MAG: hypothetical protein WC898_02365 [Candidatus Paceibacterota bacterium]|jgi:hypothetical protein